jgi:alpha-D-xyloside xylohydrolase
MADTSIIKRPWITEKATASSVANQYVFMVRNGNRYAQIGVTLNGKIIKEIVNRWVPYTIAARAQLSAGTTYHVGIIGGGKAARLWIGPRRNRAVFRSAMGYAIDYYFFYGPDPQRIIQEYRLATGAVPMFPRWAYGFWQCRERYSSQKQILQAAAEFRKLHIPVDLIIQDWQYWPSV